MAELSAGGGVSHEPGPRVSDAGSAPLPPIRFINLDRADERRRFMEAQGEALGLVLDRAAAVASGDVSASRAESLNDAWERPLTLAELGCFLSHEAIWRDVAEGKGPVLILEDDVMLSRRLPAVLPSLGRIEGIDFLNIESFGRKRFVGRVSRPVADGVSIVRVHRDKSGSAAYLLWPSGARRLLARAERGAAPVDAFLHGLKSLASFQSEPALAMQLHLLELRGRPAPIPAGSSIQIPRTRLSPAPRNLPFHARRIATQLRLGGEHLMRLFGRRYRLVDIVEADFGPADQSRS